MEDTLKNKLKYLINKKKTLPEICETLELKDYEVIGLVELMKQDGELLDYVNGEIVKLRKALHTIEDNKEDYDVSFEFCSKSETGQKILELLSQK